MGLITFSDPGLAAHAGAALGSAQDYSSKAADEELRRAQTDRMRAETEAEQQKMQMADRMSRERAATNLNIATSELAKMGVNPSDINITEDMAWMAKNDPEGAAIAARTFQSEDQRAELQVYLAQRRRAVEQGQWAANKKSRFQKFVETNGETIMGSGGGKEGASAENPLVTQLRSQLSDGGFDDRSFNLAVARVERQLAEQTQRRMVREADIATLNAAWSSGAPALSSVKRAEVAGYLATVAHSTDEEEVAKAKFMASVILAGHEKDLMRMLNDNASSVAASMRGVYERQQGDVVEAPKRTGGGNPEVAAPSSARVTPKGGGKGEQRIVPQAKSTPGSAAIDDPGAGQELVKFAETSKNDRGLVHMPTLMQKAYELYGRELTRDELRTILGAGKAKVDAAKPKDKSLSLSDYQGATNIQ